MALKSIIVKSYTKVQEEYTATAVAITPGMLLEMASATTVQAHSGASGNVLPMFAFEDELQGKTIDDAYAVSVKVQVLIPRTGDQVQGILADGQNIAAGDFLESDGTGMLQKHAADSALVVEAAHPLVGVALEAIDISDSSAAESSGALGYDKRIKLRII